MILYWSPDYVAAAYDFDTTRKSAWIIESLKSRPIAGVEIIAPPLLSAEDFCAVHSEEYVEAVRWGMPKRLAESQGFHWDPGLWTMARAQASGIVAALLHALQTGEDAGSLSSGQHHALYDSGAGFCTFNGIVIGAKQALRAGAKGVLIIDLDAHGAGGTHSLIENEERIHQLDIAVNSYESYRVHSPNTYNFIRTAASYTPALRLRLDALAKSGERFDVCLYYSGMDPYEQCEIGGLTGINQRILEERERIVFGWCREQKIPVAFGIGGGYLNSDFPRDELVNLHRLTLAAATKFTGTNVGN